MLRSLVDAWSQPTPEIASSPTYPAPNSETLAPNAQNVFQVTVHMRGSPESDEVLGERIARILRDQAKRHGIDVGDP